MSEKYLGEVSTPLLINQIKDNCTQKRTTLPIASVDELGNTYQYMGTTSGSLVHGYFYECVSDGAVTPTYTWQNVNVQPTAGTPTAATTTFDNTTSGLQATNVQDAIDEVVGDLGTAASKDFTTNVSPNNHALVESNAVYSAINNALTSVYTPRGNITCAELTSSLLIASNVGNVYNTTDSGTTTALFMQGAGIPIPQNSTVGIIQTSPNTYLFNLMGNTIDLHEYQKKNLTASVESQTTVEGALGALSTNNQATQAEVNDIVNVLGAKNLLPIDLKYLRTNNTTGTWNENIYTFTDATATFNSDGTVTVSGTPNSLFAIDLGELTGLEDVILSGCPSGGSVNTYYLQFYNKTDSQWGQSDYGSGNTVTLDPSKTYKVYLAVRGSVVISPAITFKPMVRLASDPDNTYVPYVPTNATLNKEKMSYADNGVLGAKNVLKNKLIATTRNTVTYTPNSDGTFVANGTANANGGIELNGNIDASLIEGMRYKVSLDGIGADKNGTQKGIMMYVAKILNGVNIGDVARSNKTNGFTDEFVYHKDSSFDRLFVGCYTFNNASFSNSTLKPMIRLATDSDDTYQPYAKTNQQITNIIPSDASISNKLITENDLNGTLLSASNTFTPASGYEILDWSVYQLGNHVWGTFILHKTSGDIPAGQTEVGNFSSTLRNAVNSVCFCSNNRYGGGAFYTGYLFIDQTGKTLMGNPSGTTTGINHAKISIDFCLA